MTERQQCSKCSKRSVKGPCNGIDRARRQPKRAENVERSGEDRRQSHSSASTSQQSPFQDSQEYEPPQEADVGHAAEQQSSLKAPAPEVSRRATPRSTLDSIPSLIPSDINLPEQVAALPQSSLRTKSHFFEHSHQCLHIMTGPSYIEGSQCMMRTWGTRSQC